MSSYPLLTLTSDPQIAVGWRQRWDCAVRLCLDGTTTATHTPVNHSSMGDAGATRTTTAARRIAWSPAQVEPASLPLWVSLTLTNTGLSVSGSLSI